MADEAAFPPFVERRAKNPMEIAAAAAASASQNAVAAAKTAADAAAQAAEDARIAAAGVHSMRMQLAENTELTQQVRDILTSFRVVGAVAKWLTAIVGALAATAAAIWQGWHYLTGRM